MPKIRFTTCFSSTKKSKMMELHVDQGNEALKQREICFPVSMLARWKLHAIRRQLLNKNSNHQHIFYSGKRIGTSSGVSVVFSPCISLLMSLKGHIMKTLESLGIQLSKKSYKLRNIFLKQRPDIVIFYIKRRQLFINTRTGLRQALRLV